MGVQPHSIRFGQTFGLGQEPSESHDLASRDRARKPWGLETQTCRELGLPNQDLLGYLTGPRTIARGQPSAEQAVSGLCEKRTVAGSCSANTACTSSESATAPSTSPSLLRTSERLCIARHSSRSPCGSVRERTSYARSTSSSAASSLSDSTRPRRAHASLQGSWIVLPEELDRRLQGVLLQGQGLVEVARRRKFLAIAICSRRRRKGSGGFAFSRMGRSSSYSARVPTKSPSELRAIARLESACTRNGCVSPRRFR